MASAQGLRHSVCVVCPEYTEEEKLTLQDVGLYLFRFQKQSASRYLQICAEPAFYGSGVVVDHDGLCVLTSSLVVGYARTVQLTFYLHDQTLRFDHCEVLGSDTATGLALVRLPEDAQPLPLPLAGQLPEEGEDIAAAGFPMLQGKPSWLLSRGSISNAAVKQQNRSFIQHTASSDIGAEGGPLLVKTAEGYRIIGICAPRQTARKEVAMAISLSEIQSVFTNPLSREYEVLEQLASIGVDAWINLLVDLPKDDKNALLDTDNNLPFQFLRESLVRGKDRLASDESGKQMVKRKLGVTNDIRRARVGLVYANFLSPTNMYQGLQIEFATGATKRFIFGFQLGCLLQETRMRHEMFNGVYSDPRIAPSPQFGLFFGGQIPIRVANDHLLVPRLTLGTDFGPEFSTQKGSKGLMAEGLALTTDSRLGVDYRYCLNKFDLSIGVDYDFHLLCTGSKPTLPVARNTGLDLLPYIQHGLAFRLGLVF